MGRRRFIFGKWNTSAAPLTESDARGLAHEARARALLPAPPVDLALEVLERVRALWAPGTRYYREAAERLPSVTGFSREMIALGLGELAAMLSRDTLSRKIESELGGVPLNLGYRYQPETRTLLQYRSLGVVFHVLSGNVFLVGPGSLIEGALTGNVSILKQPSSDPFFLPLFLESLREADPEGVIASRVATADFSSSRTDVMTVFKDSADALVIWGGEQAVRAYRDGLPARTKVIVFGPKLSFAVVTKAGAARDGLGRAAEKLSLELAIWDQNACTAPQVCYVEGEALARELAERLVPELERRALDLPAGRPDQDTAVEIRKLRGVTEIREARGEGWLRDSGDGSVAWTVVLEKELSLENSPLHRTIRIIPFTRASDVIETVAPYRGYLQTVGLHATETEHLEWASALMPLGAQRIFRLGGMAGGEIDDPHDGAHGLPQLLSLAVTRVPGLANDRAAWDALPPAERAAIRDAWLRETLYEARKSPFHRARLDGLTIRSTADLERAPLLDRADWESAMLPRGGELRTRPDQGGYVTRSGGSTGAPKFSYFDRRDWSAMIESASRIFLAAGFAPTDRIANFMSMGDLYGSFISFNAVNFALGAQSFCFGAVMEPEKFLGVWNDFGINAVQGIPGNLMVFLRRCRELDPSFTIEKLMYAGQPLSPADRKWLVEVLGVRRLASIIGTTEANQLGYQCERQQGTSLHHVAEDYNHVEIVDENGAPAAEGAAGRMAVTGLRKTNYPVIRYVNGDAAAWIAGTCACGRGDRVLDYRGRWDDIVCIATMNFALADARAALAGLPVTESQLTCFDGPGAPAMTLTLETGDPSPGLAIDVRKLLYGRVAELEDRVRSGELLFEVALAAPGAIERNPRTGKVRGIVDRRTS